MMTLSSTPNSIQTARLEVLGFHLAETDRAGVSVWERRIQGRMIVLTLDDAAQPDPPDVLLLAVSQAFEIGENEKAAQMRGVLQIGGR